MSDQEVSVRDRFNDQVRPLQKAAAVLGCIQHVAEYEGDFGFGGADAIGVVMEMVEGVADAVSFLASKAEPEVRP